MTNYSDLTSRTGLRAYRGLAIVTALHLMLMWGVVSGTARQSFAMIKKPMEAQLIQEVAIAPPPPPIQKATPKLTRREPPPFLPVAPVFTDLSTAPVIEATSTLPQTAAQPIAAPAPVANEAIPLPVTPQPPARKDMALVCPTQVPPEMPRRALLEGTQGIVRAQALIQDGVVREVNIVSGPRVFYAAVKAAMLQYKCSRDTGAVTATQEFNFKFE